MGGFSWPRDSLPRLDFADLFGALCVLQTFNFVCLDYPINSAVGTMI